MELNEYQQEALKLGSQIKEKDLEYCTIGFCGEAGEFANVVKKVLRDGHSKKRQDQLELELGDAFYYLARAANAIGCSLQEIAGRNIEKLKLRNVERSKAKSEKVA